MLVFLIFVYFSHCIDRGLPISTCNEVMLKIIISVICTKKEYRSNRSTKRESEKTLKPFLESNCFYDKNALYWPFLTCMSNVLVFTNRSKAYILNPFSINTSKTDILNLSFCLLELLDSIVLDQWGRRSTPIHFKDCARLCCSPSWFNIDNDDNESGWIAIWDMQVPRVCGQCGYNSGAQAWIWPQGSLTACILLPFILYNAVLSSGKTIYFLLSRLVICDYCVT